MNTNPSQTDKIVDRLKSANGAWVAMPELWQASGAFAVHSRISEARTKRGLLIDHRNDRVDGVTHSYYRLVE